MTTPTPLIAIAGYARSGKDTAAQGLVDDGWQRRGFADRLKALAYRLNPPVTTALGPQVPLAAVIDRLGWEKAKETVPGVRPYLQELGVAVRDVVAPDVWVNAALRCAPPTGLVIPDARFSNEAEAVRDRGGIVVRVVRDGVGPANGHASEVPLPDELVDHEVVNDGTVDDLHGAVRAIARLHFGSALFSGACEECGDDDAADGFAYCWDCLPLVAGA